MIKKIAAIMLFISGIVLLADIIPPGTHFVAHQVYITNASSLPDLVLIGLVKHAGGHIDTLYQIEDNKPLYKGYKFNRLDIFAVQSDLYPRIATGDTSLLRQIYSRYSPAEIIDPDGRFVSDSVPVEAEFYYYSAENVTDTTLYLKLQRRKIQYTNGEQDKIIEYK